MSEARAPRDGGEGAEGVAPRAVRLTPVWHHVKDPTGSTPRVAPPDEDVPPVAAHGPASPVPLSVARHPTPERHAASSVVSGALRSTPAVWLVLTGVVVATLTTVVFGARIGAILLSGLLATAALCRAVLPGPGPVGITIRSRWADVVLFGTLSVGIAILAVTAPRI